MFATLSLSALLQGGADIGSNQVVIAIVSLLAVGAVASIATGLLRTVGATLGLDPKTLLYGICLLIALGVQATVGIPSFTGDPDLWLADLLLFIQTAKTGGQVLYGILLKRLLPEPAPDA